MPASVFLPRSLSLALSVLLLALPGAVAAQTPSAPPAIEVGASPSPVATGDESRPEGSWDVIAYDPWNEGLVEPLLDTNLTVSLLTGGRLEGETGCGRYLGGYSLDGDRLGLGIISKGFDECSTKKTEEAVAFSVALETVVGWRASGSGLELLDDNGVVRAILERPADGGVTGDWVVVSYSRSNGKPAEPLSQSPMAIAFREDGTTAGSTGCRWFEGRYAGEGDRVVIGPIETIGLPCQGEERKPERRLLAALGEVVYWQRAREALTLTDAFGKPLVELRRAAGTVGPGGSAEPGAFAEPGASATPGVVAE